MKKVAVILVSVCVLVLLTLAIVPRFVDVNQYRPRIQSELQSRLGRPVSLGNINLSLLPPSLKVKDVAIGEDPEFGTGSFAKTQELNIRVSLLPLLRKNVQIKSLRLINPDIQLIKDANGNWNYATLGQQPAQPNAGQADKPQPAPQKPSPSTPEQGQPSGGAPQFSLGHLEIQNGRLRVTDQKAKSQNTFDNIDVTLKNFAPGEAFDVDAAVRIAGRGDQKIQVKGTAGPMTGGSAIIPFDGDVDLNEIALGDLQKFANIAALEGYNGVASGSLKATTKSGVLNSEGSLKIEDPQIKTVKLGYPITLDYKLSNDLNSGVIRIENGILHLGPTPVSIAGSMNTTPTPAQIDMRLVTNRASISEIARLAAAAGVAFNAGTNIKGTLNADIAARGATSNPALSGSLRASELQITGGQIKQPVSVPQIELSLTPSAVSSNQFTATTGSTRLNGQFTLKDYTGKAPAIQATLNTNNANIGELLSIANAYGVTAVDGMSGSGSITLNLTAAGPLKNTSAMVFSGSGAIQNASLNTPSLTKPLNIKNTNIKFSQNSMALENVAASLDQSNAGGNLSIRNFASPQIQFALNIDKLDLAALQQVVKSTTPAQGKRASLELIPRAYAQKAEEPSFLTKAVGKGNISVGQITYDQLLLQNVKSQVTLDHGIIKMDPLTSTLYGGQQSGQIVLDTRQTPAAVRVSSKLQKVDANKLVSSVSSIRDTLYGLLAANANTSFRAGGNSNVAQSLNGQLSLDLADGRLAKVDMLNQLASVGRFLNASQSIPQKPFTDITKLTGTFNVVNGLAQTNDLRAVIPGANLAAKGTANLVNNALNMRVMAVLSKDFSQKVGGTGVGGFMQTALANNKGELVMPVIVTGTFDSPKVMPDMEEIARMKVQNLVPSFSNPGDVTSGLLGSVLGGKKGQTGQQQGGLSGIIGALGGQQQKKQAQNEQQSAEKKQAQPAQQDNPLGGLLNQVLERKKKKPAQQTQPPQ